jgi:hypothetical protein
MAPLMRFDEYLAAQQSNLEQIRRLRHFKLIELLDNLYECSAGAVPSNAPGHYARLLLVCDKAFISAAVLIGRGQPEDSAGVTRRAIEAACLARAIKNDRENIRRWVSGEERLERWKARGRGAKPKRLRQRVIDPPSHEGVELLRAHAGAVSDAAVHFTPELFGTQDWKAEEGETGVKIWLGHFEPSQRVIETEIVNLTGIHLHMLFLFDECFDGAFRANVEWSRLLGEFQTFHKEFLPPLSPEIDRR